MAYNLTDACGFIDQSIPQWKRELIIRRRALGRTLQVGNSSVKLTCPAVVAIVRQPELLGAAEDASSRQVHSISNEEPTSLGSLNQNRVDFHPSTSSAVPVGNMRLLDAFGDVNNLVINHSDVKSKQSEVNSSEMCVNYNLVMGENKSANLKKKNATSRPKFDHNNISFNRKQNLIIDKDSNECVNGEHDKAEDCLSDSSEELQYGPGIVNKLKTKYLSMTLREQKRKSRPSLVNLRRATSLENMLEGDGNLDKQNKSVKENSNGTEHMTVNNKTTRIGKPMTLNYHRSRSHVGVGNQTLETMKRARSMDTLLKSESRSTLKNLNENRQAVLNDFSIMSRKPIASIINENIVIVESCPRSLPHENSKEEDVSSKVSHNHLKREVSIEAERELPPPDVVKQTLKIFETSPKKKVKASNQITRPTTKFVVGYQTTTGKPANSLGLSLENTRNINYPNKPSLSPKPILSPEKIRQNKLKVSSPKKNQSHFTNSSLSSDVGLRSPTKIKTEQITRNDLMVQANNVSEPTGLSDRSIGVSAPKVPTPQSVSPIVTVISNNDRISSTLVMKNENNSMQDSLCGSEEDLLNFEEVDANECSKPVPESALENIRRGGVSVQFSFNNEKFQKHATTKSYLPRHKDPPQALNTSLISKKLESPPHSANIAPLRSSSSPQTKQVGIIRPLISSKVQASHLSTPLTEQEIEKNLINRVKSIEQPISKVVVAIKALPDNVVLGSVSPDVVINKNLSLPRVCAQSKTKTHGLWDDKLWHQNQNTIVFNFSDRKEVPDYIENDGLILRGKRDRPKPSDGAIILRDGGADDSSTDPDEFSSDPPSPCDVTFEGDNVLINGKSNLKKSPKQVKLRIKFNDEATTMFEYPSEASLVEEDPSGGEGSSDSLTTEDTSSSSSQASAGSSTTGHPVPLGGSLGAYTPRQMEAVTGDFQLGLTPVQPPPAATSSPQDPHENHLKPAPPESTVAWSEGSGADLLF